MQIQNFFSDALHSEVSMPRATKEMRGGACPAIGTPHGRVDLWAYDDSGGVEIGEIKSVHGRQHAPPEVLHYVDRFDALASRIQNRFPCAEDSTDPDDAEFDAQWVSGHLAAGRLVWPRPLDSVVPMTPTDLGAFWLDWNKRLRCQLDPGGGVIYWCVKNKDQEEADRIYDAVMLGIPLSHLLEEELRRRRENKRLEEQRKIEDQKKKDRKPETPAASSGGGGGSRFSKVVDIAARATALGRIAKAHIEIYGAFASWAYTGMYWGTRGYDLNQTFKKLADVTQVLGNELGYAQALNEDIAVAAGDLDNLSAEQATTKMRAELFSALETLRATITGVGAELDRARDYTAIWSFVHLGYRYEQIKLALANADTVLQEGDDSILSLSLVTNWEAEAATWLTEEIEHLFSMYEVIVKHDQLNWLKLRK
jgi:hypothetical protein